MTDRLRPPILFIRHGETDWNRAMRFQGQRDIPLNALGRRQARRNGRVLGPLVAGGGWRWFASPLGRTRETLHLVGEAAELTTVTAGFDDRVQEISFGQWEGLTAREIEETDPAGHRARMADKWRQRTPGGESYAQLAARVADWLDELDEPTVAVSHGGVMRVLMHLCTGISTDIAPMKHTPQDRVVLFRNGAMTLF